MEQKIALFDMDGTLCDYVEAIHTELNKVKSPKEPKVDPFLIGYDPKYQYLWKRMDLIKSKVEFWANLPRMQLRFDVLEMTKEIVIKVDIMVVF